MLNSHVVQYRRVDWEITLDGETFAGCFNLHKPAELEQVLGEIKSEIKDAIEEDSDQ